MSKKQLVISLVEEILGDRISAEMIVERLQEEGLLHLGYGNADIDQVIEAFDQTFGTTKTSKYDRFAANRMVRKYSAQAVCVIIQTLGENRDAKYAPMVGNIAQLETKFVSVLHFLRTLDKDQTIEV